MPTLYPLTFKPIFRDYLWGGHLLAEMLGKPIPLGETCAESWEIVDHGADQSCVASGRLAGSTLSELVQKYPQELFGRTSPPQAFPLLFKFLDAQKTLSVQVHPNDAYGATLNPPDLGKTEAWVVIAAEEGSKIYSGLKSGVDQDTLKAAIENGTCEDCLHAFEPAPGDCVFIPAGTVHALGSGLVIAEIQQASDTTFRLFDWNRVDKDGKPRELHIDQALEVIDFNKGPVEAVVPKPTTAEGVETLVECDYFTLARRKHETETTIGGDDRFHLLATLEGSFEFQVQGGSKEKVCGEISKGEVLLLPAASGELTIVPDKSTTLLDIYLP